MLLFRLVIFSVIIFIALWPTSTGLNTIIFKGVDYHIIRDSAPGFLVPFQKEKLIGSLCVSVTVLQAFLTHTKQKRLLGAFVFKDGVTVLQAFLTHSKQRILLGVFAIPDGVKDFSPGDIHSL